MNKELNYFNVAGDLQTKALQFNALGLNTDIHYDKERRALKYIDDLICDLREYKKLIKRELAEKEKMEAESE